MGAEVGNICQIEAQAYFFHAVLSEFLAGRVTSRLSHKFIQKDDSEDDAYYRNEAQCHII
jgi:hypothetical protein